MNSSSCLLSTVGVFLPGKTLGLTKSYLMPNLLLRGKVKESRHSGRHASLLAVTL